MVLKKILKKDIIPFLASDKYTFITIDQKKGFLSLRQYLSNTHHPRYLAIHTIDSYLYREKHRDARATILSFHSASNTRHRYRSWPLYEITSPRHNR